ncbi:MAG: hypothetical protein IPH93_04540 [Saprospiraceae bacterium]|nr:hypothetical protein [Saprospiraceae bacterium]
MKISKTLIPFFILFISLVSPVASQKITIDSSFGEEGLVRTLLRRSGGVNTLLDSRQKIILLAHKNLAVFDSTGSQYNLFPHLNPLVYEESEEFDYSVGARMTDEGFLFVKYLEDDPSSPLYKLFTRKINLEDFMDSTYSDKGKLFVSGKYSGYGSISNNEDKFDLTIMASNVTTHNRLNLELFKIDNSGNFIQRDLDVDHWCPANGDDLGFQFSNIIRHSNSKYYTMAAVNCNDTTGYYLMRFDENLIMDQSFGVAGFKEVGRQPHELNQIGTSIQQAVVDKNGNIYFIYSDYRNSKVLIEKRNAEGSLINEFGTSGVLVIDGYRFDMTTNWDYILYREKFDHLYFFAYNPTSKISKLFVINPDGTQDSRYEITGGFQLNGTVLNLTPYSDDCFIATGISSNQSPNTIYMVKFCDGAISETQEENSIPKPLVKHDGDKITIINFGEKLRNVELFNLDGKRIKSEQVKENSDNIVLSNLALNGGIYYLLFVYNDHRIMTMPLAIFK